ncbi:MAG TPA: NADH-quinone oxidoreductase subunit NuoK [Polyangia bacterium]|jgi:NADH-quinone oxidoreductase subunit K
MTVLALSAVSPIGLGHFLVLSALLFTLGLVTAASRRSAVAILMGIELILNAAALNFVAFSHFSNGAITGQVFAVFVVVLAAAEATVALAIVLAVFRGFRTVDVTDVSTLKD